ncbi:MAG: Tim44 domain-containing protein [Nitrospirae bacterium]|nr:Tim44 domain-containing protein [Magnetococcales bacterium]HAT49158.1 hypothetical protein [Alphaproteobacteria bacterium]
MFSFKPVIMTTIAIFMAFGVLSVFPDEADAKRMGGGSSFGSRGSKSFSAPQQPAARTGFNQSSVSQRPGGAAAGGMFGGIGSGLLGGLGGLMLGGMLGSMLFGGAGAAGTGAGGIGLMEILLIGGAIWFGIRWYKRQRAMTPAAGPAFGRPLPQASGFNFPSSNTERSPLYQERGSHGPGQSFDPSPSYAGMGAGMGAGMDEVSQGLEHIASMDRNFNEGQFLSGAKQAFQQMQQSWCDGNADSLRPLLTTTMLEHVLADMKKKEVNQRKDHIDNIQFQQAEISEAWQESGEDWITVRFQVSMLEYSTDAQGVVVEGDRSIPVVVEEYWTFTRPVGSRNPNWFLTAIQQQGQSLA